MKYKEFKKAVEDWGRKHSYATEVEFGDFHTNVKVGIGNDAFIAAHISSIYTLVLETKWNYAIKIEYQARVELFDILVSLAKTPIIDRKDEKREDEEREEEDREYEEREDNKTLDSIIHRLEVIQTNAEDVMNWTIEEIQERSWDLRNSLEDMIIDLEELKETNERE